MTLFRMKRELTVCMPKAYGVMMEKLERKIGTYGVTCVCLDDPKIYHTFTTKKNAHEVANEIEMYVSKRPVYIQGNTIVIES